MAAADTTAAADGGYSANSVDSGAGGSSFISGHAGCDAASLILYDHLGYEYHYSNYIFFDTIMIAGNNTMPKHADNTTRNRKRR